MLSASDILDIVQNDVITGLGNVFEPTGGGFSPLTVGEFEFIFPNQRTDIRPIDSADENEQVSCVLWSYEATHERPILGVTGVGHDGERIPVIERNPPLQLDDGNTPPAILPTGRPVLIAGATVVVARDEEQEKNPMLLRFVDWADVFAQLGFPMSTRPPEREDTGFQRIQDVVP
jgi:hypothetical protein